MAQSWQKLDTLLAWPQCAKTMHKPLQNLQDIQGGDLPMFAAVIANWETVLDECNLRFTRTANVQRPFKVSNLCRINAYQVLWKHGTVQCESQSWQLGYSGEMEELFHLRLDQSGHATLRKNSQGLHMLQASDTLHMVGKDRKDTEYRMMTSRRVKDWIQKTIPNGVMDRYSMKRHKHWVYLEFWCRKSPIYLHFAASLDT